MTEKIPDAFKEVLNKPGFAHLATLMKDGSPQVTPVWYDFDGTHIRVNSAKGRLKDKNMRRNKRVALSIQDPDNIPIAILLSAAMSTRSRKAAPMRTLILWRKNTWTRTAILFARPGRCG